MTNVMRLLNQIENEELVLPEFQREFTWNKDQAKKLIESFLKNYPTGALLFWKTKQPIALKNMPDFEFDGRVEVILDGQQRLTTLYLLIKNEIPPYYGKKDIGEGKDIRHLHYNLETRELEYYKKLKMENNPRWIRVTDCFSPGKIDAVDITEEISNGEGIDKPILKKVKKNLDDMQNIREDDYKVIYVKDSANLREALEVFDRVNSAGTPLTNADIALAHMCSKWPETRRVFKNKTRELQDEGFDFDLTFFVRAMNAVVNHRAEYRQLHDNTEEELKEGFEELERILDYLVNILKDRAYIYGTDDLNTDNVLIPVIGYLSLYGPEFDSEKKMKKMLYWLYAALYQRRFTSSVDQKLEEDLNCIKPDYTPGVEPIDDLIETLKEDKGDPAVTKANLTARGVGHPLYDMTNIVIRAKGGVDWANGIKLSKPFGKKYRVERHHVFPQSVLEKEGYDTGNLFHRRLVHEIANRVPLTRSSNMEIFDKKPQKYFPILEKRYPGNLKKFFIPMNQELWKLENYEDFLERRRELIAEGINAFMKSLIAEPEKEEQMQDTSKLVERNEGEMLEFKASLRWNVYTEEHDKRLEKPVLKTICAFLNADGGVLLIGVRDNGDIFGIEKDVQRFGDLDKYELHLSNLVSDRIGNNVMPYVHFSFPRLDGQTICRVDVEPSPREAYLQMDNDEKFYVRMGNHSRELPVSEAKEYIDQHWN